MIERKYKDLIYQDSINYKNCGIFYYSKNTYMKFLFNSLSKIFELSQLTIDDFLYKLDSLYLDRSGNKLIYLPDYYNLEPTTDTNKKSILDLFTNRLLQFHNKWERLINDFAVNFDFKSNYNISDVTTSKTTNSLVETNQSTKSETGKESQNSKTSYSDTNTETNKSYGFNSNDPVNVGGKDSTKTSLVQGSKDDNYIDTTNSENQSRNIDRDTTINLDTQKTISGTNAKDLSKLFSSEVESRLMYNIINIILDDVDSVICLKVY